jgi:23S rRNA pseudouridine2604 synthase
MVTLKLKKPAVPAKTAARAPVRGSSGNRRPTLAEAQTQRAEREAAYQEARVRERQTAGPGPRRDTRAGAPDGPFARPRPDAPRGRPVQDPRGAPFEGDPRRRPPRADPAKAPAPTRTQSPPRGGQAPSREPWPGRGEGPSRGPAPARGPAQSRGPAPRRDGPPADPRHRAAVRRHDDEDDDDDHQPAEHAPGSMRLSKRMSELGIASRREADEWIAKGWVRVDDQVVAELGSRVLPGQRITVDAKAKFQQAQRVTVLVNKPVGYVSGQAEDGYEPALVLVQPQNQWRDDRSGTRFLREHLRSLVPAGRLDIDSVGLLVLTQDGRIAKQLIGEDSEVEKEYLVRVEAPGGGRALPDSGLELLRHGLELDGEALRPAEVEWLNDDQLRFVLRQGKKRQIRRMCEAVGLKVVGLKRVRIGSVMLGDLPTGQWRYLRPDESFV